MPPGRVAKVQMGTINFEGENPGFPGKYDNVISSKLRPTTALLSGSGTDGSDAVESVNGVHCATLSNVCPFV